MRDDSVSPDISSDKIYDPELLESGDSRNVVDRYRYMTVEAIRSNLDLSRTNLEIAIENWQHDFNIGSIVRTANAFNVSHVHIVGKKHWNRRGAMVTDRYMNISHHKNIEDFLSYVQDKSLIGIDNLEGALPLSKVSLPEDTVLVFGGEGPGLSEEMQASIEKMVMIEQFGSTRSINVGVAAGIAMYAWVNQHMVGETEK